MTKVVAILACQPTVGQTTVAVNLGSFLTRAGHIVQHVGEVHGNLHRGDAPLGLRDAADNSVAWKIVDVPGWDADARIEVLQQCDSVILVLKQGNGCLQDLARTIQLVIEAKSGHPSLKVQGVLVTFSDKSLDGFEKLMLEIENVFPVEVFDFCIPVDGGLPNSVSDGFLEPTSRSARGFVELTMEMTNG